jgi:hypothetical protein
VKEFIPEPPSAQENQAAPRDISLFWPPMVAPKYGPGAARPPETRAEDPAGKAGLLKEIARTSYPIHTIPPGGEMLGMGKDVLGGPAGEVEPYPVRQEAKAGRRQLRAPLADENGVELFPERVQVQHIGRGVGELRVG